MELTLVFPRSSEDKSVWKGNPDDLITSSCKRVEPFARTTLVVHVSITVIDIMHEALLSHMKNCFFSLLRASNASGHPLWSCHAATSPLLTPSSPVYVWESTFPSRQRKSFFPEVTILKNIIHNSKARESQFCQTQWPGGGNTIADWEALTLLRCNPSLQQNPIQHPAVRNIDILNRLPSLAAVADFPEKSRAPVRRESR